MIRFILSLIVLLLSLINSFKLILDGIFLYLKGNAFMFNDYWWYLVKALDIEFRTVGIVVIGFGFLWLVSTMLYLFKKPVGRVLIMFLSLFTMWSILWGAVLCFTIFLLNFFVGDKPIIGPDKTNKNPKQVKRDQRREIPIKNLVKKN